MSTCRASRIDRREFLQSAAVVSAGLVVPAFLPRTIAAATPSGAVGPAFKDDRILVVVQLGGGNDGLNTIIPCKNDAYHRARKTLRVTAKDAFALPGDDLWMHGGMTELKSLFDDGRVAIVNGAGYPNPNRSHFRSMEIWHTATDSDRVASTGWIGRYFDNCCSGKPVPLTGVNIGPEMPQAFSSRSGAGVSFQEPQAFRWLNGGNDKAPGRFRTLNQVGEREPSGNDTLDFLRHVTANVVASSQTVQDASKSTRKTTDYPRGRAGRDLQTISQMIRGGLPTRIYYVSITGFDTHANQQGAHERLLREFSDATAAFYRDMKTSGLSDRVMLMCFSEFGRRVTENASRGTDHGTAGPMFLIGDHVRPGCHGTYPDLTDLEDGDMKFTVDFRTVYGSVMEQWLDVRAAKVLGREFPTLDVVG